MRNDERSEEREDRREQRLVELGTRAPGCSRPGCGERDPAALTGVDPVILCYEHRAEKQGRSWVEEDHFAGRANDPTKVRIPGNDHRVKSDLQHDWPEATLRNPDLSPLLRAAAMIRGWTDALRILIERVLGWVPPFLEWLDEKLHGIFGDRWWEELGWTDS